MTKFNDFTIDRVLEGIKGGLTYKLSAEAAGMSNATLTRWLQRGEEELSKIEDPYDPDIELPEYAAFVIRFREAEGRAAKEMMDIITAAAATTWQAAAWRLERRYPTVFGKRYQEISGKDGKPVPIAIVRESTEDL